jgi:diacylglycerol kinase
MDLQKEKKAWQRVKYHQKFLNAFRGMYVFLKTTKTFYQTHLPIYLILIILGFCFQISNMEWIALVLAIGLMLISEVFNTAIEIDIDLTSPGYHPYARDTKDVAAAAVALSGVIALIIVLIIFLPKIF